MKNNVINLIIIILINWAIHFSLNLEVGPTLFSVKSWENSNKLGSKSFVAVTAWYDNRIIFSWTPVVGPT